MKNVVILANIEWNFLKQRHQYVAEGLSELDYNVVFVESSAKRNPTISDIPRILSRIKKTIIKKSNSKKNKQPTKDSAPVSVISPLVLPSTNWLFNTINDLIFSRILEKKIKKELVNESTTVMAYAPTHTTMTLIKLIAPTNTIYDCVTNFEGLKGIPREVVEFEKDLLRNSSVIVDCDFLLRKHKSISRSIEIIEPGVNAEQFLIKKRSSDIKKVCYFGLVSEKLDMELIYKLSESGILVDLIGEIRVDIQKERINRILPPVPHNSLPETLASYDALVLPYNDSEYTKGVIPAKFFECFATGLPIIASNRENFQRYKEHFITGNSNEDIVKAAKIYKDSEEKRISRLTIAKEHDWISQIKRFAKTIEA